MIIERHIAKGQLASYVFGQTDLAASQSDVQLVTALGEAAQATVGYEMPWDYDIVAVAYSLSAAGSAGTLTIGPTIGGTENASGRITITTETDGYLRIPRGTIRGNAGGQLGSEITTDGAWNGTTADLSVTVYVIHSLEGI